MIECRLLCRLLPSVAFFVVGRIAGRNLIRIFVELVKSKLLDRKYYIGYDEILEFNDSLCDGGELLGAGCDVQCGDL